MHILLIFICAFAFCVCSENVPPMSGFYTEGLDKVLDNIEIVYPEKVSKDGSFVSYYLPHYYNIESSERQRRTPGVPQHSAEDAIHFFIPIEGEKHHLELWPNMNFIAPGLVVEHRDARDVENINKAKISRISQRQCHYSGQIVGKGNSSAALSTCYGLAGYIRIPEGDEYLIEPVKDSKPTTNKEHPHIIYKRSSMKDKYGGSNCLTKGRAKEALEERMQWEAVFGDNVRREMSGININEILKDSNKDLSSQVSYENILSPNSVGKENPVGNINQFNKNLDENNAKTVEGPQFPESNNQFQDNEVPKISGEAFNKKLDFEKKLKQNKFKEEANMGNIQLPEINLGNLKTVQTKIDENNPSQWGLTNRGGKQVNDVDFEHTRFKREINSDQNDEEISKIEKTNKIDCGHDISNNVKGEQQNSKINKLKCSKNRRSLPPVSSNKEGIHDHSQPNNALQNKLLTSKKESSKLNQIEKLNDAQLENDQHVVVLFEKKSALDKSKNNNKIKRDNDDETKQDVNESVTNSDSSDQSNDSNRKEYNDPNQLYASSQIVKSSEEEIIPLNSKENDFKREIRLDTSEQSWQLNKKSDKSELTPDKIDKKKLNLGESDKLPEDVADTESLKESANEIESDRTKELDSTRLTKLDKENLNDDENIMSSVVESVVDDINKLKVKKDIGLSNTRSENKLNPQDLRYFKVQENMNERLPQNNQKMYLPNSDNMQNKYKAVVNNQQIYLPNSDNTENKVKFYVSNQKVSSLSKKPNENVVKSEGSAMGHTVQDITTKNSGNGDEIIIKIKAPENTITGVKQISKSEPVNMKQSNALFTNIADDDKGKGVTVPVQNYQLSLSPLNTLMNEKIKRGVLDKLSNESPTDNQDEKIDLKNTNVNVETQQQKQKENNDQSKDKNKREDTIHLVIETEPEINHPYNTEANMPKPNLFCQGKNCLEIKPVVLNESNIVAAAPPSNIQSSVNNTNTEMSKTKILGKREAEDVGIESFEGCAVETTTLKPLACFDFFSKFFNLELMITVDYKVVKMHEGDDVENFILTIVNMVSTNFYDKSIGINLSIMLIRLVLLTTCIKELDSDQFNPDELLENFCTWQSLINPGKDDHPHHHDLAIFVTRMDKCEGQVMGVSYMTSVCRPDKACLVCVDEGLLLANTITHQIGHSFGAEHDDGQSTGCSSTAPDGTSYHMAPTIRETSYSWSVCSRDAIVQFLRTQGSWCLTDQPTERTYNFPLILPGQIYSAAQQCRLNYHMAALPCAIGAFCEKLYCQVTEKLCATKGDPPADGTFCASDMWCFHKECVHIGRRPGAVNGEWGPWTEWTICTRSCGGGVSSSYRICNNPKPSHGGRYCIGDRMRHRMCSIKPCQGFIESFRDLQCKKTEDRPFQGIISNWAQYHSFFINIECALVCQNRKGNVVMRSPIVADGTPCKAGTRNVCIQGACRNVGCDWVIDSFAKEDVCGMCHGNSTECKVIQGVFEEASNGKGMVEFLRVPKHSGMVFIREIAPSTNVLAVSGAVNRVFYLNGKGTDDALPGDVAFGFTNGVYEVRSGMERIFIRGPTTEDLLFYVSLREQNKGIHYQYAVPDNDPTYVPRYLWQYLDWDPCTDPCSGGSQRAQAKCVEDKGGVVDDTYCPQSLKPLDVIRPCNEFPCQAKWWVSVWSDCICTGPTSLMFRSVLCMRATDESGTRSEIVKESECANHKKPRAQKPCNESEDTSQSCFIKRSVQNDEMFRSHRDMRRAINPKTAYVMTPANIDESKLKPENIDDNREIKGQINNNINPKKGIKAQDSKTTNVKGILGKFKSKQSYKDTNHFDNEKRTALLKNKETSPQKFQEVSNNKENDPHKLQEVQYKEDKHHIKEANLPLLTESVKQAKLRSASDMEDTPNRVKQIDTSKQIEDSDTKCVSTQTESTETSLAEDKCDPSLSTTNNSCTQCQVKTSPTTDITTCKTVNEILPHERTTCCKMSIAVKHTNPAEPTTLRPINSKVDELDVQNFSITVVPLVSGRNNQPQSDPEYIHFGDVGQFRVVDENNGTILNGQQALDFLEYARNNASEEPVIMHEDTH